MMHRRGAGTGCEIPGAGGRCSRFRADIKSAPTVWTEVHAVGGVPGPGGWRADVGIGPYEAEPSNPGGNRNLVPGGHKARPYGKTGGGSVGADFISARPHQRVGCTHPVGADVGIGPYEAEPSNPGGNRNLVPGGHKARPYEETGGGAVGAACMAARAHRRVGCTIAERTPHGIDNKSTIAERTRHGARQAMVRNTQGRWSMRPYGPARNEPDSPYLRMETFKMASVSQKWS